MERQTTIIYTRNSVPSIRVTAFSDTRVSTYSLSREDTLYALVGREKKDFLLEKKAHQLKLEDQLRTFYAAIVWENSKPDRLEVKCTDINRDILNWRKDAKSVIEQFFDDIVVRSIHGLNKDHQQFRQRIADAPIHLTEESEEIKIVGFKEDVDSVIQTLEGLNDEVEKSEVLHVKRHEAFILKRDRTYMEQYPSVRFEVDVEQSEVRISGRPSDVKEVVESMVIQDRLAAIISFSCVPVAEERGFLMQVESVKNALYSKIEDPTFWEMEDDSHLQVFTFSEQAKNDLLVFLEEELVQREYFCPNKEKNEREICEKVMRKYQGTVRIDINSSTNTFTITSLRSNIANVVDEFKKNGIKLCSVFTVVDMYSPLIYNVLNSRFLLNIEHFTSKHRCVTLRDDSQHAFYVKGGDDAIANVRQEFQLIISNIKSKDISIQFGISRSQFDQIVTSVCQRTECTIARHNTQEDSNIFRTLIVHKGDVTEPYVDVMIISSNPRLQFVAGLSKIVLKKGNILQYVRQRPDQ